MLLAINCVIPLQYCDPVHLCAKLSNWWFAYLLILTSLHTVCSSCVSFFRCGYLKVISTSSCNGFLNFSFASVVSHCTFPRSLICWIRVSACRSNKIIFYLIWVVNTRLWCKISKKICSKFPLSGGVFPRYPLLPRTSMLQRHHLHSMMSSSTRETQICHYSIVFFLHK